MTETFKIEIISPDKSFYNSENVNEVVVPAVEGDMGILKNHIPIISFLKPGLIKVLTDNSEDEFYVEDGILEFKVEIVNPEKSFLLKEDVTEVVVPAFEGEMGILKDHISIISFLKPGIVKVYSKSEENKYFLEDGIVEFKDNSLSILTSSIYNISDLDRNKIDQIVKDAEKESGSDNIDDQKRYLIDQKIEVLKSLQLN